MKKEKREKKPLEGYIIATVYELFKATKDKTSPLRHTYVIRAVIPDPRCTVKVVRIRYKMSTYQFTKTTKIVSPLLVTIFVYSRSFKKRDLIKDLNGMEFTEVGDRLYYLREKKRARAFVLDIREHKKSEEEYKIGPDIAYSRKYQIRINASDIKYKGSVLRYLFKTTDEKLSRNFVS